MDPAAPAEAKSTARDARSGPSAADVARLGGAAAVGTASVSPAPTSVTHPSGGPAPFRTAGRAAGRHGRGAPGAGTQDPGGESHRRTAPLIGDRGLPCRHRRHRQAESRSAGRWDSPVVAPGGPAEGGPKRTSPWHVGRSSRTRGDARRCAGNRCLPDQKPRKTPSSAALTKSSQSMLAREMLFSIDQSSVAMTRSSPCSCFVSSSSSSSSSYSSSSS